MAQSLGYQQTIYSICSSLQISKLSATKGSVGSEGREEQFLRGFWQGWPCAVLRGQLWRGHPTLTIQFLKEVFKGLVLLGTDKTGENKTE